jgi:hypothetical protein
MYLLLCILILIDGSRLTSVCGPGHRWKSCFFLSTTQPPAPRAHGTIQFWPPLLAHLLTSLLLATLLMLVPPPHSHRLALPCQSPRPPDCHIKPDTRLPGLPLGPTTSVTRTTTWPHHTGRRPARTANRDCPCHRPSRPERRAALLLPIHHRSPQPRAGEPPLVVHSC